MPTFANPTEARFRAAFSDRTSGRTSAWNQARFRSHDLGFEPSLIEDDSIRASGEEEVGHDGKYNLDGSVEANWHAEDHEIFLASHFGKGNTPVEAPTGVWTKRYDAQQTALEFGTLDLQLDDALGRPTVYREALIGQIAFNLAPNGLFTGSFDVVPSVADFFSEAVELVATGTPTAPLIQGLPSYANLSEDSVADGDIYVRINALPGGTQLTIEAKVGAGSAYSNTQTIETGLNTVGDPIYVELEDQAGVQIGDDAVPVKIHFPNTTYTVLDEWRFDREIPSWAIALPTAAAFSEVLALAYVDGEQFRLNSVGLTATRPVEADEVIGGRFNDVLLQRGDRTYEWTLSRKAVDRRLIDKLIRGSAASFQLLARAAHIGATGVRRSWDFRSLNCRFTGKTPTIGGRDTFDESITMRAYPSTDGTYPAGLNCTVVNSIEDIAA